MNVMNKQMWSVMNFQHLISFLDDHVVYSLRWLESTLRDYNTLLKVTPHNRTCTTMELISDNNQQLLIEFELTEAAHNCFTKLL